MGNTSRDYFDVLRKGSMQQGKAGSGSVRLPAVQAKYGAPKIGTNGGELTDAQRNKMQQAANADARHNNRSRNKNRMKELLNKYLQDGRK